jgi:hypothetical protein
MMGKSDVKTHHPEGGGYRKNFSGVGQGKEAEHEAEGFGVQYSRIPSDYFRV